MFFRCFGQLALWGPRVLGPPRLGVVAVGNTTLGRAVDGRPIPFPRAGRDVVTNFCPRSSFPEALPTGGRVPRVYLLPFGGAGRSRTLQN